MEPTALPARRAFVDGVLVNLGNPNEFTIEHLAKTVVELTGSKSEIIYEPLPSDDPTRRQPDIGLARERLDWEPETPLEAGLRKTIEWFKTVDLESFRPPTPNF